MLWLNILYKLVYVPEKRYFREFSWCYFLQ